jgi:hypothetical protein
MNNLKSKKFITTTLIFVLVMALTGLPLPAKEQRGSNVVIILNDGHQANGELLAVKSDALLIYNHNSNQGKSIDLQQVVQVIVLKKSKGLLGLAIGLGVGVLTWVIINARNDFEYARLSYIIITPPASLLGGIIGTLVSVPEEFYLSGESSQDVLQNLGQLKRYAREQ